MRLRRWLPVIATSLLLLTPVMAVGAVCVCASDHQYQGIERVLTTIPAVTPAVIEVWGAFIAAIFAFVSAQAVFGGVTRRERASPVVLQRFVF